MPATAVRRGCGTRVRGGIYSEVGLHEHGLPLEHFLVDPPSKVDTQALGVSPVGVTLINREGVWHILDWVGSTDYPNVADFVEEVRRFGMSRRLPKTLDFSKLTTKSRHILLHARAWIEDVTAYDATEEAAMRDCPRTKGEPHRTGDGVMCARFWWQDVDPIRQHDDVSENRTFVRTMPSFSYEASTRPKDAIDKHAPAVFLSLPIERLAVVRDPESGSHQQALEAAGKSGLRVALEDE